MFKKSERRNRRGFTLAEVLTVVAIIGILLAVAIPNVLAYYRSLKLTELDDSAKTIFMAAQSRLTAMTAAGEDLTALGTSKTVSVPGVGYVELTPVTEDANLDTIVLGGSIESQLHDGHYVVEIFPDSGVVYAVWYWEDDGDFEYSKAYTTVNPDKSDRLKNGNMVGYYGGPGFDSNVERLKLNQTPIPSLQVTNAEELLLTITVPRDATGPIDTVKANVTITASGGGEEVSIFSKIVGNDDVDLVEGSDVYTGTIALDTLKTDYPNTPSKAAWSVGKSFKNWVETVSGSGIYTITPGANFDITVKVTAYDAGGNKYISQRVYWRDVNSLFADVEEITDPAGLGTGKYTAHIAYGRHLQNLNKDTSGVTDTITSAVQTRNIDFDATGVSDVYSWAKTYGTAAKPIRNFTPIKNDKLTSYNGAGLAISELLIDETGENVGLFGTTAAELKKIRLVNADVTGGNNVGALAGQYNGTVITNCGAYVDEVSKPATVAAVEHPYDELTVEGAEHVGGLVGNITSAAALSQSFASVKVTGATDVGGLVGQVNSNSAFTNCYSGGHTVDGKYVSANVAGDQNVGGLIGGVDDSTGSGYTLTFSGNNYSTCSVGITVAANQSTCGQLIGTVSSSVNVQRDSTTPDGKIYATGEAFDVSSGTPTKITTGLHDENTYLGTDRGTNTVSDFITVPYDETLKTTVYPYATHLTMHYGDWLKEASASSFCYYDVVNGTYGVWGYIVDPAGGTTTPVNTLAVGTTGPSGPYATDDGYCVLVKDGDSAPASVTVDGKSYDVEQIKDASNNAVTVEHDGTTYELHKITGLDDYIADVNSDGSDETSYYYEIDLGGAKYWFNPFFACEIVQETTTPKPATPQAKDGAAGTGSTLTGNFDGKVVIRTARQLANLAAATGDEFNKGTEAQKAAQKRAYVQLLNIDYDKYADADLKGKSSTGPRQTPASLSKNGGSYDGNHFFIRNLYIGEGTNESGTGLFGNTRGTLSNIRLVNVSIVSTSGNENHTGALAGRFQGDSVTDCGVYVDNTTGNKPTGVADAYETFKVVRNSDKASTGGLIGSVKSGTKLEKCFAAVKVKGYDEVGGLIGKLAVDAGVTTTLTDCYSGGHTKSGTYDTSDANVSGNKQVGGLIGYVEGDDNGIATLSGVNYSTCSVSADASGSDLAGLLVGGVRTDNTTGDPTASVTVGTTNTAYALGAAIKGDLREETYLTTPTDNTTSGFKTYPYDEALYDKDATTGQPDLTKPKQYPYVSGQTAHYGDWPVAKIEACFYWAKEGSGYEVYVLGLETGGTTATPLSPISTLCKTHHSVEEAMGTYATSNTDWGYGTIGLTDTLSGTGVTDISATAPTGLAAALNDALAGYSYDDATVKVYTGATADASTTVTSEIDNPAGGKYTYYLNLGFAAAISLDNSLGSSGTPYQIRNVRQLDNIPDKDNHSYQQTHDVYAGSSYIYTGASDFGREWSSEPIGTYDGQSYRILELNMTSGLFTSVRGYDTKLENIILYSPSGTATVTGSGAAAGGLAGSVTGYGDINIANCVVAGYSMSNSSQYLGGLVGEVNRAGGRNYYLYINNSEAVNKLEYTGDNAHCAGGVVGCVNAGSVNITNSYAGSEISGNGYFGGIVGLAHGTYGAVIYKNVYSYMKITSSVKYGIGPVGYRDGNYQNCHYWSDGLSGRARDWGSSGVTAATLDQLKTCMGAGTGFSQSGDTVISFWAEPDSSTTTAPSPDSYPFPAVVKGYPDNTKGTKGGQQFVHYGYWPNNP